MLYHCNYCNLSTNKKSNWKRHILTKKHINNKDNNGLPNSLNKILKSTR